MNIDEFLTPDSAVIYPSRGRILLIGLGAAAFVASGLFIWRLGGVRNQIVAVAAVGFFGICFLFALYKLIWRQPALIINSSGLLDNSSALGRYAIRWNEVESVYISTMRTSAFSSQRFLSIRLKRPEEFLSRQSAFRARLMKANMGLLGAPVNISRNTLPIKLDELMAMVQQKCSAAGASRPA